MALKLSVRVLLVFFFVVTFLNIAKHFIPSKKGDDYPTGTTILQQIDITTNDSPSVPDWYVRGGFDWDALIVCSTENASDYTTTADVQNATSVELESCPDVPPDLGPVGTGESMINLAAIQTTYVELKPGGIYKNRKCKARQSVAIIVPYSGNKKFLHPFLYFIHPFLMKQQLEYQIFVVAYSDKSAPLNRGHLFNIGVAEALKLGSGGWSCLVLHEVNVLPLDMRNLYRCSWFPRQLVAAFEDIDKTPYAHNPTGGAIAITPDQFMKINGFSNTYLERDAFYDNFYRRILAANYTLEKSDVSIGMYRVYVPWNVINSGYMEIYTTATSFHANGYSNLSYELSNLEFLYFYTHVNVSVPATTHTDPSTSKSSIKFSEFVVGNEFFLQ